MRLRWMLAADSLERIEHALAHRSYHQDHGGLLLLATAAGNADMVSIYNKHDRLNVTVLVTNITIDPL